MTEPVPHDTASPRDGGRTTKSAAAFRTISEVATDLDVAQHVLRFWESKFPQVRPLKRGGGRRYYRPEDVDLLRQIRSLLYDEGYTIKGVQKLMKAKRGQRDEVAAGAAAPVETAEDDGDEQRTLRRLRRQLVGLRDRLRHAAQ
ncbi:MAG: MerR family transcriptional regulator [Geminicoccaceae bacterium]|nr:MAG: MerR family transcriptional regulator [Geminicoccaceae bacterium]